MTYRYLVALMLVILIFIGFQSFTALIFSNSTRPVPGSPARLLTVFERPWTGPDSSEGYRYYVLNQIVEYLSSHPLFGSNFRGLYLLFEEYRGSGSTHSQYTDVFLRTGLLGGVLWLYLLYRILRFCKHDTGLRLGLASVIVYGFFHETFKESQGSFVFAMLLSFSYMRFPSRENMRARLPGRIFAAGAKERQTAPE
jgi:O-antigen ligase